METSDKQIKEIMIENMLSSIKEHGHLFYNDGWDELIETYSDDDIFNILSLNNITNLDDAIEFFDSRFNPYQSSNDWEQ